MVEDSLAQGFRRERLVTLYADTEMTEEITEAVLAADNAGNRTGLPTVAITALIQHRLPPLPGREGPTPCCIVGPVERVVQSHDTARRCVQWSRRSMVE